MHDRYNRFHQVIIIIRVVGVDSRGEDKDSTNCVICLTGIKDIRMVRLNIKHLTTDFDPNSLIQSVNQINLSTSVSMTSSSLPGQLLSYIHSTSLQIIPTYTIMIFIARLPAWQQM